MTLTNSVRQRLVQDKAPPNWAGDAIYTFTDDAQQALIEAHLLYEDPMTRANRLAKEQFNNFMYGGIRTSKTFVKKERRGYSVESVPDDDYVRAVFRHKEREYLRLLSSPSGIVRARIAFPHEHTNEGYRRTSGELLSTINGTCALLGIRAFFWYDDPEYNYISGCWSYREQRPGKATIELKPIDKDDYIYATN